MKIADLRQGQEKVNIEAVIKDMEEPREFNKFGRTIRVANAMIEDDSGSIKLTLWNQDIDKAKKGATVKVTNGFVNEFQGEIQLTGGKFGKVEFLSGSEKEAKADSGEEKEGKEKIEEPEEEFKEESEEGSEDF